MSPLLTYTLLGTILLLKLNSANSQLWADDHPTQSYTVYNGKVYIHPKEEPWYSNLFKFDLYNNPVVQTVIGWSDALTGHNPPVLNETATPEEIQAALGSQNNPQYSPLPSPSPSGNGNNLPGSNPYPYMGSYGSNQNAIPNYGEKYPQQLPNSNPGNNPLSYPYSQMPQFQQYQPQPPSPINSKLPMPMQFPQQPQMNYGYNPQQVKGPALGFKFYGNPNTEIINQVESQGSIESILEQTQARNFQSNPAIAEANPNLNSSGNKEQEKEKEKPSPSHPSPVYDEASTEETKTEGPTIQTKVKANRQGTVDKDEDFPCPKVGQWKWDGEVCIAIGPYPTWACKPTDMVSSGRIAICRNKIFYPNEP